MQSGRVRPAGHSSHRSAHSNGVLSSSYSISHVSQILQLQSHLTMNLLHSFGVPLQSSASHQHSPQAGLWLPSTQQSSLSPQGWSGQEKLPFNEHDRQSMRSTPMRREACAERRMDVTWLEGDGRGSSPATLASSRNRQLEGDAPTVPTCTPS